MNDAINAAGLNLIKRFEGLRLSAYVCPAGYITVGYGHRTGTLHVGERITEEQAAAYLAKDVQAAWNVVMRETAGVKLTSNQRSAVTSLVFNIGEASFMSSTMRRMLRAGDTAGASRQFPRWVYAHVKGKAVVLAGLVKRRAAERELFDA